jgi:sigma-B regulation protein RsbU (phosphoserine phosphatase)
MFSISQLDIFDSVTKIVSVLYQIIQSYVISSKQDHLNQEIEFTRLLQKSLLPKDSPTWKPFEIYAFTRSAKEVSGDFYDFVPIDANRLLVVLGDASGKGIPACMMMAMTRSFIRANAARFTTLSDMMLELNSNLYRDTDEGRFTTITCCVLDKKEQTVEFARAGHTELIVFSSRQKTRKLRPHGTALGLLPTDMAGAYDSITFTFKPYYSMLLFSDGIIEAVDPNGEEFGTTKLEELFYESCCRKNSPEKTTDKILRTIDEFSGTREINDDQTIVIIGHESSFI